LVMGEERWNRWQFGEVGKIARVWYGGLGES
jgi:hypothetical protein